MMTKLLGAMALLALAGCTTVPSPSPRPFHSDRISVEAIGSGPDVVLIPGLGSSPRLWDSTVAAIPGYRYHLVHVAGFDGAPAGANANGLLLGPVADEVARYIRDAGLDRPAVVGHSLGGLWGLMIAARHPRLPSKLMVVDMPPLLAPMIGGPAATLETVRAFAEQARRQISTATDEAGRKQVAEMVVGKTKDASARAASIRYWLASDPKVTSQGMYELFTTDLRPELPNIEVPLIVLWAAPDGASLNEAQTEQFYKSAYAGTSRAVVKQVSDSHHLIMFDQPEVFRRELTTFLKGK